MLLEAATTGAPVAAQYGQRPAQKLGAHLKPILSYQAQRESWTPGGAQPTTASGKDSRPSSAGQDWLGAHQSPSYLLRGGATHYYDAYQGMQRNQAARREWEHVKERRARDQLRGMAGDEGQAYGYQASPNDAPVRENAQVWHMAKEQANIAGQTGRANAAYGYLPTMASARGGQTYNRALGNKAIINGAIESNVDLTRSASAADNVATAEAGARQASFGAAASGMTGSSVDTNRKQRLLGGYLGGRAQTASTAMNTRLAGQNAMEQERISTVDRLKGKLGGDYQQQMADMDVLTSLSRAKNNIVPGAIGQGIETGGTMYANNQLYNQMMQGGAKLPSLSKGSGSTGGLATKGR